MSAIDVSSKLGEYLLKGWVLTDETCRNENCPVPLMRSPKGHSPPTVFCANCDGDPRTASKRPVLNATHSPSIARQPSPSTVSSSTPISRTSTPPTEISSGLSSPTFALPVETAESARRREQADAASSEIGVRLLKGWAMLADECPNPRCFGVPLVRPPLIGGRDLRKECVACRTVYIDEKDAAGWNRLVGSEQQASSGSTVLAGPSTGNATTSIPAPTPKEATREIVLNSAVNNFVGNSQVQNTELLPSAQAVALKATASSLELALQALSQRLSSLAGQPAAVEPGAIANTADAMGKVLDVLAQVGRLRGDGGS